MPSSPIIETPIDSPTASGATTPRVLEPDIRHKGSMGNVGGNTSQLTKKDVPAKKLMEVEYDSDIDPDELLPVYLDCKTKLFKLQAPKLKGSQSENVRSNGRKNVQKAPITPKTDPETAKLLRKINRIEDDVLFDQYVADQQWESRRIQLERDAAARRHGNELAQETSDSQGSETLVDSEDEVSREAARIGAAMLEEDGSDDDAALADLFSSLPVNEVDPLTGKSSTVVQSSNGIKVTIKDFGKWTGVNPTRVLEEACRAR